MEQPNKNIKLLEPPAKHKSITGDFHPELELVDLIFNKVIK